MSAQLSEDAGLKKALGRYLDIVEGHCTAQFALCKAVAAERRNELDEMQDEHAELLKELIWMKEQGLQWADLKMPDYSLLDLKIGIAEQLVKSCVFCERKCRVDRTKGQPGFCGVGYKSHVASAFSHTGEEPEFVPSGTIFFSGCNSRCVFCQNYDISQQPSAGEVWDPERIATWLNGRFRMRSIINANLVGGEPTPNLHNILKAMRELDVNIPIIWNSNMYMSEEGMDLLHGVVDVYLADFKYGKDECAQRLSSLKDYTRTVKRNHLIAAKQTEMLIRHLVMPNHVECCSKPILDWIKEKLGDTVRVNIMSQYSPYYRAYEFPEINRRITGKEYEEVVKHAQKIGLTNTETQLM